MFSQSFPLKWGRWSLNCDAPTTFIKVDQANEDHCGCCVEQDKLATKDLNEEYEQYLLPYCLQE